MRGAFTHRSSCFQESCHPAQWPGSSRRQLGLWVPMWGRGGAGENTKDPGNTQGEPTHQGPAPPSSPLCP